MISILVPIYNVERYLQRCIDSVLSQDYTDWELILVDDGSTDGSLEVLRQYEQRPSPSLPHRAGEYLVGNNPNKIKLIHKENGGLPSARLAGYREAKGEFLIFLDADDWLLPGALETLFDAITSDGGYDVVRSVVKRVTDSGQEWLEHYGIETGSIEGEGKYLKAIQGDSISPYLHSGMYRADLFSEKVFLPIIENGISVGEDWFANYYVAPKVKRVKFVERATFAYFVNRQSMMGDSVYGWEYYDKVEQCKIRMNQELGLVEDDYYLTTKALMDLRYFFFPEVAFSWSHFRKIQPLALKGIAMQNNGKKSAYNPKTVHFLQYPALFFLYTSLFRLLFWVAKLKCHSRKVLR